jgi:transposase-like protein
MEAEETYTQKYVNCPQCGVPHLLEDEDKEYDQQEFICTECKTKFIILD